MTTVQRVRPPGSAQDRRPAIALLVALVIASMAGVSAHVVRGVINPTLVTAFVSSPLAGPDAPIKILWATPGATNDTGHRVVCFYAANTSVPRADDDDWPRITAVGFELPGTPSGFSLLEPVGDE